MIQTLDDMPANLRGAVVEELTNKLHGERAKAVMEQAQVAKELGEQKALEELGRARLNIHPFYFHHFGQKYGYECWRDSQFVHDFERDFPAARVKSSGTKIQVGYRGGHQRYKKNYG